MRPGRELGRMSSPPARERGVALLGTVAALAALTIVATGLAASAGRTRLATHTALRGVQADALVRSGAATAAVLLEDQARLDEPASLRSVWARPVGRVPIGAGWVEATVEDEARRLDLSAPALTAALPRLLAQVGLDPALAEALADWTDADEIARPHGAERAWYRTRPPGLLPPNGPVRGLGELALVRGFDAKAVARLRPLVTARGDGRVNPNTAPHEVLEAWLDDPARARALLAQREHGLVGCDDLPACTTRAQRFRVRVVAGVDEVRRAADVVVWTAGGRAEVTAWRAVAPP